MDNEMKGLLDALNDQIHERDHAEVKLSTATTLIEEMLQKLSLKVANIGGPKDGWTTTFTTLLDEGDYVSAVKLAVVARDSFQMGDEWEVREEMARRLFDESKRTPKVYDLKGSADTF